METGPAPAASVPGDVREVSRFDATWRARCSVVAHPPAIAVRDMLKLHYLAKPPGVVPCRLMMVRDDWERLGTLVFALPPPPRPASAMAAPLGSSPGSGFGTKFPGTRRRG